MSYPSYPDKNSKQPVQRVSPPPHLSSGLFKGPIEDTYGLILCRGFKKHDILKGKSTSQLYSLSSIGAWDQMKETFIKNMRLSQTPIVHFGENDDCLAGFYKLLNVREGRFSLDVNRIKDTAFNVYASPYKQPTYVVSVHDHLLLPTIIGDLVELRSSAPGFVLEQVIAMIHSIDLVEVKKVAMNKRLNELL